MAGEVWQLLSALYLFIYFYLSIYLFRFGVQYISLFLYIHETFFSSFMQLHIRCIFSLLFFSKFRTNSNIVFINVFFHLQFLLYLLLIPLPFNFNLFHFDAFWNDFIESQRKKVIFLSCLILCLFLCPVSYNEGKEK